MEKNPGVSVIFRRNVAVTLQYPDKDLQGMLDVINQTSGISGSKRYLILTSSGQSIRI